jgi:choline dehydrogenase-like flavoprotein
LARPIFDAIVVGTGAGGSTAMKLLCEAGLDVCALNSGPRMNPEEHYRGHRQVYELKYRGFGDPFVLAGKPHQEHYTVEESEYSEGKDLFEHDVEYSNSPGTDWYWKRCKATGGKANF